MNRGSVLFMGTSDEILDKTRFQQVCFGVKPSVVLSDSILIS